VEQPDEMVRMEEVHDAVSGGRYGTSRILPMC
jgi:hypothetical protein